MSHLHGGDARGLLSPIVYQGHVGASHATSSTDRPGVGPLGAILSPALTNRSTTKGPYHPRRTALASDNRRTIARPAGAVRAVAHRGDAVLPLDTVRALEAHP